MTNEEARRILIQNTESLKANPLVTVDDCLYEAFDIAVKALEQHPSKNVINKIKKSIANKVKLFEGSILPCEYNDALQDVLKIVIEIEGSSKGKWIKVKGNDNHYHFECSVCGQYMNWIEDADHYCCNCGAEMSGGEEDV